MGGELDPLAIASNKIDKNIDTIIIYYDGRYPSIWIDPKVAMRCLRKILDGLKVPYRISNADELRDFMIRESGIIIFTSDVAPDTVWNCSGDSLILRWIMGGGILVWTGDWELHYIGYANGSMRYLSGSESKLLDRPVTVAIDEGVIMRPTESGAKYIPSFKELRSRRPFDESRLVGLKYEAYGAAILNGVRLLDPCAVGVGEGFFIKVSATTFDENFGFLYAIELILNRFYGMRVKLTSDPSSTFINYTGIVYILPSKVSSPYWQETFGDRIYFYTESDLSVYKDAIKGDFRKISSEYSFIILMLPLDDSHLSRMNAQLIDEIASLESLDVLYVIFPKWNYGPEWDYLIPGSRVNRVLLSTIRFLSNLSSTVGVAVWYGWKGRGMDPRELENFYLSLPDDIRGDLWLWLDEPFIEEAQASGIIRAVDKLNITLVTELYSPSMLASYHDLVRRQVIITGYRNACSVDEWVNGVRRKLELISAPGRILGIWIFWDENDGSGEAYRAYIGGELKNPIWGGAFSYTQPQN